MDAEFRSEDERDRTLLRSFHDGDIAAFGELYACHRRRVLRLAWRLTRDWHLAEDIAQETFVKALSAAPRLTADSRFWPWLRVIAWRTSIDALRLRGKVQPATHVDPGAVAAPADAGLIAQEDADLLQLAFTRVRPRHAQVLTWQAQGATYEEIAQRLGVPVATVTSLLHRARQALRREYLALTGPDHLPAILSPTLLAISGALRRLRDRLHQLTTQLPDATAVVGTLAAVTAISLTPLLPHPGDPADVAEISRSYESSTSSASRASTAEPATSTRSEARGGSRTGSPPRSGGGLVPPVVVRSDVGEAGVDDDGSGRTRERARDWPILFDQGPVGFGINPQPLWEDLQALQQ